MMGAGKSSVGRELASRLALAFRDSDAEIERRAGRSIPEIFRAEGEPGFRRRERDAVASLRDADAVVALGGGAAAQAEIRELLRAVGTSVYLRARPETLLARLGDCRGRPLLEGLDEDGRQERLAELLAERAESYEMARLIFDTDELALPEVAKQLAERLSSPASPAPNEEHPVR